MSRLTPRMRAAYHVFWEYRDRRRAIRTLAAMDEALLKDIGISRSEIHPAVHGSMYGHEGTAG
jgi:uncharacterized protein YjiS (DUF1127 family)